MPERSVVGWDIGGAHVKAALLHGGQVLDTAQWPCPLWQGTDRLQQALDAAGQRAFDPRSHAEWINAGGEVEDRLGRNPQRPGNCKDVAAMFVCV